MPALTTEHIFDAVLRIQLLEERKLDLEFSADAVHVRFPTTRRIAEFLAIPHYYVLPQFAAMEEEGLVTRAERVGIMTTPKGTRTWLMLCRSRYEREARGILGPDLFDLLAVRVTG
jgi:Mn-dependent DtxR family transcriptional regulator